jgi:glycosyltransferase involved in cell wall biosynthesis
MLQRAVFVHYTSDAEKLSTEGRMGLNQGKVIALGIETSTATNNLADHFPELAHDPYVLVLSRLHPKKGLDVLIDAFQSLETQHWRLVIAGDGPSEYVSRLKSKVKGDRILFTGWLEGERKEAVLGGASLLVLPSHQENFGLCVMEALAHSVPVLVSPNVNLATEIAAHNAGWIATIDKDALAAKLAEAMRDKEELSRRGRAGRQLSQKYSWENAARDLVTFYREVLTTKAQRH